MQAMRVGENFHMEHSYATQGDQLYFKKKKRTLIKVSVNETFKNLM